MKLLTSILFLLITSTYAARLSIDVFPSSHLLKADGTAPTGNDIAKGCLIPHLGRCGTCSDTNIKKQLKCVGNDSSGNVRKWTFSDCDCPTGSSCKEHDPFLDEKQPTCRVDGREVHMGATEYDFEALNMVLQDTQIRPSFTTTNNDLLAAFSTVVTDGSGNGEGQKDKYPRYSVRIEGIDGRAYKSCSVTATGTVANAITTELDLVTNDVATNSAPKMTKNAKKQSVECLFRPYNEAFLGMVKYNISFDRDPVFLSPLEDPLQSVEMQIKFVPNPTDDAKWHLADQLGANKAIAYLFPDFNAESRDSAEENLDQGTDDGSGTKLKTGDTGVFRFHSYSTTAGTQGPGFDTSSDSALKGTLKLPVKGKFLDKRYLIVDESGTDVLIGGVGEGEMRKEGMEIHKDFDGFYDPTRDAFDNLGLKMHPVAFSDRIANTDLNAALKDAAQFQMEHTYAMTFGGGYEGELAHFQPDYLACDICPAQIVFKAFPSTLIHDTKVNGAAKETDFLLKYHVSVTTSVLPTSTNVVSLNQIDVDVVEEASGHRTYDEAYGAVSVSRKMALRLPSAKNPQNPDGYPLYQFLRPKISTLKKDYTSLLSAYNFSMSILDFEGNSASGNCKKYGSTDNCLASSNPSTKKACITEGCNWVADKGLVKSGGCKNGKLYEIGTNIFDAAEKVFKENCRIQLVNHEFGKNMNITFGDKTAYLRQNDLRSVYAGATELSILRRKLDPSAVLLGNKVSFKASKYGHTGEIEFEIRGTESMVGFSSTGKKCTTAMMTVGNGAYDATCSGIATAAELNLTISSNAKSVEHSVRSSPSCFRYFDIELHDVDDPWAIYQLRLPCNRITNTETEALNLTYTFTSAYDLFTDRFTGSIGYDIPSGQGLVIAGDTVNKKQYGFGSCAKSGGLDVISRPAKCVDVSSAEQPVSGWGSGAEISTAGTGTLTLDTGDKVDLEALRDCDQLATDAAYIDDSGEQYVMKHSLALMYTREDPDNAGRANVTYCQDQEFITTIRRDATASVTVGTLVDKSLERSVMVTSIDWVQCSKDRVECKQSDDCYKLRIEMDARDQDVGAATWADTKLTNVEIGLGSINTDSLTLDITGVNETGLPTGGYLNNFALESVCGVVDDCNTGTGSHYDSLIEQETHFVVSGFFDNIISTSNVEVETKFESCPITADTAMDGDVLRLGMQLSCVSQANANASDVQTSGGDLKNTTTPSKRQGYKDCTTAEATAYAKVSTEVAVSNETNKDSAIIDANDFAVALAQGWKIQNVTYIINRYESLLDGSKDVTRQVSSTPVLRFGRGNSTGEGGDDDLYDCQKLASRIPGLSLFDEKVMDCDDNFDIKQNSISIGSSNLNHDSITTIYFDLLPLLDANLDVFEVEADALLFNSKIDVSQNPTRRRLRSVKYRYDLPRLNAGDEIVGTTSGFRVLAPSKEVSDEALPAAPADAPVSESGKADSTSSGEADVDTWLIVVIVVCVVAIAGVLLLVNKDKMCPAAGAAASASPEEVANLLVGNRKTRFSNLRY